jgi:hypothetical protein
MGRPWGWDGLNGLWQNLAFHKQSQFLHLPQMDLGLSSLGLVLYSPFSQKQTGHVPDYIPKNLMLSMS